MREARCVYCGCLFTPTCGAQAFCRPAHRRAEAVCRAWRRRVLGLLSQAPIRSRRCAACGEPFVIRRGTARFCGPTCRQRHHRILCGS